MNLPADPLQAAFSAVIDSQLFPGAVLVAGSGPEPGLVRAFGTLDGRTPCTPDSRYDLASLTKVVATLPAIMKLFEYGELDIEEKAAYYLSGIAADCSLRQLLTHTSGLPAYSDAWQQDLSISELEATIRGTPQDQKADSRVLYSCLNFIILKLIAERIVGDYSGFVRDRLFRPLGLDSLEYCPDPADPHLAHGALRLDQRLVGEVDDELAWKLGGTSGNAGLFGTAGDLYRYGRQWLDSDSLFPAPIRRLCTRSHTDGLPGERRGLGWLMAGPRASCGSLFSAQSFGHTGFTGTSLWLDPESGLVVALLSNRVFYDRRGTVDQMWAFRRRIHHLLACAMARGEFR